MSADETDPLAVQARGLSKKFGGRFALRDLELSVEPGEGLAVFGPNGAGKTTLLRILSLEVRPTAGDVRIAGCDPRTQATRIRGQLGCISHRSMLYDRLTARENLEFFGRLYGVPNVRDRADSLLEEFALDGRAEDPAAQLSRGMRQRLSIARALVHEPALVLLDEPFSGLDRQAAAILERMLQQLGKRGCTRILVTHDIDRGLRLSTRYAYMTRARLVQQGASEPSVAPTLKSLLESRGAVA